MLTPHQAYEPGTVQGRPFGREAQVAHGNPALAARATAVGAVESDLIERDLNIFKEVLPGKYDKFTSIFFSKKPQPIKGSVHEFFETGWSLGTLVVNTNAAAVAAVANASVTQAVVLTAGTIDFAGLGMRLKYPTAATGSATASEGLITAINRGTNTITITSKTGYGLPAVTAATSTFAQMGAVGTDGQNGVDYVTRKKYGTRYNLLGTIMQYKQWNTNEITEIKNNGRGGEIFEKDIREIRSDMRKFMTTSYLNGQRGEGLRTNALGQSEVYLTCGGVFPTMVEAGASYTQNVPLAGLKTQLEAMMYGTNFNADGATRTIIAADQVLGAISDIYKENITQCTWDDMTAKLDINAIVRGGANYKLMSMEMFRESSLFDPAWGNRILMLDDSEIEVVAQTGTPFYREFNTNTIYQGDGALNKKVIYCAEANFSLRMAEPRRHAACDVIGI